LSGPTASSRVLARSEEPLPPEASRTQRRERMELAETTLAWLAGLRQRLVEVEEETEEAFRERRQLVKFLVAGITAGSRKMAALRSE
jgi:hypothetical protein